MKITYTEEIERRHAIFSDMRCPACYSRNYEVVRQLEPASDNNWVVRCSKCGAEGLMSPTREVAIARWRQIC